MGKARIHKVALCNKVSGNAVGDSKECLAEVYVNEVSFREAGLQGYYVRLRLEQPLSSSIVEEDKLAARFHYDKGTSCYVRTRSTTSNLKLISIRSSFIRESSGPTLAIEGQASRDDYAGSNSSTHHDTKTLLVTRIHNYSQDRISLFQQSAIRLLFAGVDRLDEESNEDYLQQYSEILDRVERDITVLGEE